MPARRNNASASRCRSRTPCNARSTKQIATLPFSLRTEWVDVGITSQVYHPARVGQSARRVAIGENIERLQLLNVKLGSDANSRNSNFGTYHNIMAKVSLVLRTI